MNHNQIYKRMNECYATKYGTNDSDEWFGTDDETVWIFQRPASGLKVKMVFAVNKKRIDCYRHSDGVYVYDGNYSW